MSLVFYGKKKEGEKSIIHDHPKHKKKKKELTLQGITIPQS
jgi:hypothetical protein